MIWNFTRWLRQRRLSPARKGGTAPRPFFRRYQPLIDLLEDRWMPSTIAISPDFQSVARTSGTVNFDVDVDIPSSVPILIDYATNGAAGVDFQDNNGSILFAPGETHSQITVALLASSQGRGTTNFTVTLNNLVN